jgi:NCS1 family nucleobase:cation symporter-1
MLADYWILRNRYISLRALYRHPDMYSFYHGFNLRAMAAFISGIVPNLPGLASATGRSGIPIGAQDVYSLNWLVGLVVSFVVYLCLGVIWKMDNKTDDEEDEVEVENISFHTSNEIGDSERKGHM